MSGSIIGDLSNDRLSGVVTGYRLFEPVGSKLWVECRKSVCHSLSRGQNKSCRSRRVWARNRRKHLQPQGEFYFLDPQTDVQTTWLNVLLTYYSSIDLCFTAGRESLVRNCHSTRGDPKTPICTSKLPMISIHSGGQLADDAQLLGFNLHNQNGPRNAYNKLFPRSLTDSWEAMSRSFLPQKLGNCTEGWQTGGKENKKTSCP